MMTKKTQKQRIKSHLEIARAKIDLLIADIDDDAVQISGCVDRQSEITKEMHLANAVATSKTVQ